MRSKFKIKRLRKKQMQIKPDSHQNLKRDLIGNLLKEILYNSLSQAIIKIFLSRHLSLKLFLTLFVLITTCLTSYLSIQSIMTYFAYTVTQSPDKYFIIF